MGFFSVEVKEAAAKWREMQQHSPSASLIMMVGLPRSGKSTLVAHLREELNATVVCPDSVRLALHGQRYLAQAEPWVWATVNTMVPALIRAGNDPIILDATNMLGDRREEWTRSDLWDVYYYHVDTPPEVCIARAYADGQEDLIPVIKRMDDGFVPLTPGERQYLLNRRPDAGEEEDVAAVGSSGGCGAGQGRECRAARVAPGVVNRRGYNGFLQC